MKKYISSIFLLGCSVIIFGQVGINTNTPAATLEVVGKPATATAIDGVIVPRLTGSQLRDKNAVYTSVQTGALVYVTAADSAPAGQTVNVTAPGVYYYDGSAWQNSAGLSAGKNIYTANGTLTSDRTVNQGSFNLQFTGSGNVGIGTTASPGSKLEVNGSATNTTAYNAGSSATIDFSQSNLAYTTSNPTAFTLNGIKDGGTYTLAVKGTASATASFIASGFTFKSTTNAATTAGKETVYTFLVIGSTVYYYMVPGF